MKNSKMIGPVVLCLCVLVGQLNASAIPMWEFLSRQEKMSFLYSLFANQVDSFCESSTLKNCNQDLLKYGLNTLKNMSDDVMDATDPYQRNANSIIWQTLMKGHRLALSAPKITTSSSTAKPNSYDDDESFGDDSYGDFGAASARIDNVYRVPPPAGFVPYIEGGPTYPHNVASFLQAVNGPVEDKKAFKKFQEQYVPLEFLPETGENIPKNPLTGPIEIKVYPDGTPVDKEFPVHQDEDLKQYKLSKVPIPNL